ncbi:DUF2585 domain-containing protein [Escherichia coli]|nr:DUF2585 domain-containing protein [Salmonella enterica subsp. enterica]EBV3600076.1 DUF2585 domain-containing protein [Salmonella enterica subsp. enterica serovar Virchow]EBW1603794.1 DUF2585 domain-containing protein [Salmonella enterica subsp. enterica serovar Kottbus]EFG2885819.1 DUF2585 domain-containing protein [Escherichia coli]MIL09677.1 DUF2585 domain-containing protein [Salmonella enterica subsp. enterica serovar Enteritidis]
MTTEFGRAGTHPKSLMQDWRFGALVVLGLVALQALILRFMGRIWICKCGYVEFWHGAVDSGNSQHIADWYTFSHIIHGFLFYGLTWLIMRRASFWSKLSVSIIIEAAWEILENSPIIINRYREATISLDYFGDSIINSVSDTVFMIIGFVLAARLPVWVTVALAIIFEIMCAYIIRDNLTLNVLMLVYPLDGVKAWQAGG